MWFYLQALQEISVEERKRTLENNRLELQTVKKKLEVLNADIKIDDKRVQEAIKKVILNLCRSSIMNPSINNTNLKKFNLNVKIITIANIEWTS